MTPITAGQRDHHQLFATPAPLLDVRQALADKSWMVDFGEAFDDVHVPAIED